MFFISLFLVSGVHHFDWLWYSIITVTGVGYGDFHPHTMVGKLCGSFLAVVGVVLFCMAATQLVYNFVFIYYLPDVLVSVQIYMVGSLIPISEVRGSSLALSTTQ